MKKNKDYEAYYYRPLSPTANVTRLTREECERMMTLKGDALYQGFGPGYEDKDGQFEAEFSDDL